MTNCSRGNLTHGNKNKPVVLPNSCFPDRLFHCRDLLTTRNGAIHLGESLETSKKLFGGSGVPAAILKLINNS